MFSPIVPIARANLSPRVLPSLDTIALSCSSENDSWKCKQHIRGERVKGKKGEGKQGKIFFLPRK